MEKKEEIKSVEDVIKLFKACCPGGIVVYDPEGKISIQFEESAKTRVPKAQTVLETYKDAIAQLMAQHWKERDEKGANSYIEYKLASIALATFYHDDSKLSHEHFCRLMDEKHMTAKDFKTVLDFTYKNISNADKTKSKDMLQAVVMSSMVRMNTIIQYMETKGLFIIFARAHFFMFLDEEPAKLDKCENCAKPNPALLCGGCKKAAYCSKECQKKRWKFHKLDHDDNSKFYCECLFADIATFQNLLAAKLSKLNLCCFCAQINVKGALPCLGCSTPMFCTKECQAKAQEYSHGDHSLLTGQEVSFLLSGIMNRCYERNKLPPPRIISSLPTILKMVLLRLDHPLPSQEFDKLSNMLTVFVTSLPIFKDVVARMDDYKTSWSFLSGFNVLHEDLNHIFQAIGVVPKHVQLPSITLNIMHSDMQKICDLLFYMCVKSADINKWPSVIQDFWTTNAESKMNSDEVFSVLQKRLGFNYWPESDLKKAAHSLATSIFANLRHCLTNDIRQLYTVPATFSALLKDGKIIWTKHPHYMHWLQLAEYSCSHAHAALQSIYKQQSTSPVCTHCKAEPATVKCPLCDQLLYCGTACFADNSRHMDTCSGFLEAGSVLGLGELNYILNTIVSTNEDLNDYRLALKKHPLTFSFLGLCWKRSAEGKHCYARHLLRCYKKAANILSADVAKHLTTPSGDRLFFAPLLSGGVLPRFDLHPRFSSWYKIAAGCYRREREKKANVPDHPNSSYWKQLQQEAQLFYGNNNETALSRHVCAQIDAALGMLFPEERQIFKDYNEKKMEIHLTYRDPERKHGVPTVDFMAMLLQETLNGHEVAASIKDGSHELIARHVFSIAIRPSFIPGWIDQVAIPGKSCRVILTASVQPNVNFSRVCVFNYVKPVYGEQID
jgi:hypothetical protein